MVCSYFESIRWFDVFYGFWVQNVLPDSNQNAALSNRRTGFKLIRAQPTSIENKVNFKLCRDLIWTTGLNNFWYFVIGTTLTWYNFHGGCDIIIRKHRLVSAHASICFPFIIFLMIELWELLYSNGDFGFHFPADCLTFSVCCQAWYAGKILKCSPIEEKLFLFQVF